MGTRYHRHHYVFDRPHFELADGSVVCLGSAWAEDVWQRVYYCRVSLEQLGVSYGAGSFCTRYLGNYLFWIMDFKKTSLMPNQSPEPPLTLSVPMSRFTSRVGGGSAFYVRPLRALAL